MPDPGLDPADFRDRLDRAFGHEPQMPDPAEDLIAAHARLRRRRTTWVAAATVLAVIAVPTALALGDRGRTPQPGPVAPTPSADAWRWESYRSLQVRVPASWGFADANDNCTEVEPAVRRPTGISGGSVCTPATGYGVEFPMAAIDFKAGPGVAHEDASSQEPGWWGYREVEGTVAYVKTRDQELTQTVLDSVSRIDGVDHNGCASESPFSGEMAMTPALATLTDVIEVSVCRYAVTFDPRPGLLVQSERLSAEDSDAALAALRDAPLATEFSEGCPFVVDPDARVDVVLMRLDGHDVWINWVDDCRVTGVLDGSGLRELTADVMHWALSPGWAGAFPVYKVADHDAFEPRTLGETPYDPTSIWDPVSAYGVSLRVPLAWHRGGDLAWCASYQPQSVPLVSVGHRGSRDILCHPTYGYGVSIGSGEAVDWARPSDSVWQYGDEGFYPTGAWIGVVYDEHHSVVVRTTSEALTQWIINSVSIAGS